MKVDLGMTLFRPKHIGRTIIHTKMIYFEEESPALSTDTYALCDNCKKEMIADTGCHSYWYKEKIIYMIYTPL